MTYVQIELRDGTLVTLDDDSKIQLMDPDSLRPEEPVLWMTGFQLHDKLEGMRHG